LFVKQAIRFLQSLGVGQPTDASSQDVLSDSEFPDAPKPRDENEKKGNAFQYSTGRFKRARKHLNEESTLRRVLNVVKEYVERFVAQLEARRLEKWRRSGRKVRLLTDARYDSCTLIITFDVLSIGFKRCGSERTVQCLELGISVVRNCSVS